MSEQQQTQEQAGSKAPEKGDEGKPDQTFTQADVDRIVSERIKREREKFADYDDLKTKAQVAKTAEERIAALEQEIETSKREALRAKYAADVPERLRPLLTGTTEDELKAQRDLLIEGESERKQKNNVSPREGNHSKPADNDMRSFARQLFQSAD